jgi:hypothetical protein
MAKLVYGNLTRKEKIVHLKLLEDAVVRARRNLEWWENSLAQLKKELKGGY